jgi:hypothetical protein
MNKEIFFNTSRIPINEDDWFIFLRLLKDELSDFLDCDVTETSIFWDGQDLSYASFGCCIDIIADIFLEANVQYGGVICYTKNYGESVYISVTLLAFLNGKRIKPSKFLVVGYSLEKGWETPRWRDDVYGEWESCGDMERWGNKSCRP